MIPYGRTVQHAIAAMSRLAEIYPQRGKLSAAEIADCRHLPRPVVAKVLTVLSQAGLVIGSPGPGGGYSLARPPQSISLFDVAVLFERHEEMLSCPFGPDYCGVGPPCPLHDQLSQCRSQLLQFLQTNTFAVFCANDSTNLGTLIIGLD